jgi:hypothetical protein
MRIAGGGQFGPPSPLRPVFAAFIPQLAQVEAGLVVVDVKQLEGDLINNY